MYILKFKNLDCWIAPWNGDPGRTIVKHNSKKYETYLLAERDKDKILKNNNYREFDLIIKEG